MKLYFHDDKPAAPGEKHGERGPTHAATVTVEFEYQAELWIEDAEMDYPQIVRIECPELDREWLRGSDGKFAESCVA